MKIDLKNIEDENLIIFKPIPNYDGYYADYYGQIWSCYSRSLKRLSMSLNGNGYFKVRLKYPNGYKTISVHKLVCSAFNGIKPTPLSEVRHLDGKRINNCSLNLLWGTRKENAADRKLHGTESAAWVSKMYTKKDICIRGHSRSKENLTKSGGCKKCRKMRYILDNGIARTVCK